MGFLSRDRALVPLLRKYTTTSIPHTSLFSSRHLLCINDLTPSELTALIDSSRSHKTAPNPDSVPKSVFSTLFGKTIALMFNKRSTRTRVSCESAIASLGGHSMFLGQNDIQLGVNESLRDTSIVISSMTAGIIARVAAHQDILDLAQYSSVPVINALSDDFHPLQALADFLTVHEAFPSTLRRGLSTPSLGLEGMKICWVGDSNNVLFDLCSAAIKLGVHITHAAPKGYEIPEATRQHILKAKDGVASPGSLTQTNIPEEAVKDADVIFTDTWISMGWEAETAERMKAFQGFKITEELAKRGGANEGWRFMHCLPRHAEEVSDEVFYGPRSLVFNEAQNRLWTTIATLKAFVVNKGKIV